MSDAVRVEYPEDVIREGPDWLALPAVQELLRQHDLVETRIVPVGPRQSYSGKTWLATGTIRMVSVGVHPVRWLLTLLHELAHIMDFRVRRLKLRRDGRHHRSRGLWGMDRPHGELWQRQFQRLVQDAVAEGLFPGNERGVLDHAASGSRTIEEAVLDLGADPRIHADELRRMDEERQLREQLASQADERHRALLHPGDTAHFDAGPSQGVVTGTVVRLNRKTFTVQSQPGEVVWRVPHGLLSPGPAPEGSRGQDRRQSPSERFHVGQKVRFRPRSSQPVIEGEVLRVNRRVAR